MPIVLLGLMAPVSRALAKKPSKAAPATAAALPSPKLDVKNWTLANGLEVLFLAEHKAPIATVQVFYHVGSKDEHIGIRGVAHMFEHMMFKGSQHVPPEEHARMLKEVGGQVNAFTSEDVTAYHDTVPPSYVGFAMKLEAERMRQLKLLQQTVNSERQVVEEEKRLRIDNDPIGKAIEKFRSLAYVKHPYNWTPIGTIEDLRKVTPADCQRFYDTYYQPNNATLIVVGDIDEADVRKLASSTSVPSRAAPSRRATPSKSRPRRRCGRDDAHRGPDPGRGRRLPHPARRRSRYAGAGGAGDRAVQRRIVAPEPAAGAARAAGDRSGRRRPSRWSTLGCSSSTPRTSPTATPPRSGGAGGGDRARA